MPTLSSRSRAALRHAGLALVVLGMPLAAHAQPAAPDTKSGVPADVVAAHRFALMAYPDLTTRPVAVKLLPLGDGRVIVEIHDRVPAASTTSKDGAAAPLVTATVAFDGTGRVKSFAATGSLVDTARNQALQQQIAAHPEWNEPALDAALRTAGGKSAIQANAPAALGSESAAFFGQTVAQDPARFRWKGDRMPVKIGAPPAQKRPGPTVVLPDTLPAPPALAVTPAWVVEVTANPGSATPTRYRLEYEPFGGRLVSVVRQ